MKVLILAGGKGTRLLPLTKYHPKVLSSIHGKPFLHYLLKLYKKYDVIMSIGHMKESIKSWCKENDIWIEYAEEDEPMGHSGAILYARPFIGNAKVFAVVNGDTYHNIDINSIKKGFSKDNENFAIKVMAKNMLNDKIECSGIYIFKDKCFKFFRKGIHTDDIIKCIPFKEVVADGYFFDIGSHVGLKYAKQCKYLKGDI